MSCNCKSNEIGPELPKVENNGLNPIHSVLIYGAKLFGFVLSLLLIPVINAVLIKMMFQAIVLNKNVDMKKIFEYYFKKKKEFEDLDDDTEDLDDEDEYEMLNVEEITQND